MSAQSMSMPLLENIQMAPVSDAIYEVRFEPTSRRVRAFVGSTAIADSIRMMLMRETARLPVYYFPTEDVRSDLLIPSSRRVASPHKGEATYFSIEIGGRTIDDVGWRYLTPPSGCPAIGEYVAFHWNLMDAWFEEDEEVFVHARDPYKRVDILESSRHVRVVIGGETVADTHRARFLFESSLPTRYYIPRLDVRMDLLQASETVTACPYKGRTTSYWSATAGSHAGKDIAWSYGAPTPECAKIANLVCFFNERVDTIYVDGVKQDRPNTPWS